VGLSESPIGSATFLVTSIARSGTRVTFVRTDSATQGNWKGVYGAQGFSVFGSGVQLPAYCQFSGTGKADYTWTDSSQDTRAMQRVVGTGRVAAVWYSSTLFLLNLDLTDGETHRIAFYFLDWDNGGRTQTVEVLDANSAAVLYSCVLSEFTGGKYLV